MVYIQHIETLVPETSYSQEVALEAMTEWSSNEKTKRYMRRVYQQSAIEKRYSVVPDFHNAFFISDSNEQNNSVLREPTTKERNDIFAKEANEMVIELAKRSVRNCPDILPKDITHVITASCTGFYNPGPDLAIVQALGLADSTERYNLGFMGCYAAFPALRMASQFCQADKNAVVLIVCVELCSLHLQLGDEVDTIIANSVFSDGAAAAIVSANTPQESKKVYSIGNFSTALVPDGEQDMAWRIGDHGFDIVLSKYVPRILAANIREVVEGILSKGNFAINDISKWAVHPGGRAILDKFEESLCLESNSLKASRKILRNYGNMSSATILFVLKDMLLHNATDENNSSHTQQNICAIAFGPGLTVESAMLCVCSGV